MRDDDKDTKKQKMMDRRQAKKRKQSVREYENSPEDEADDAKGFFGGGSVARGAGKALRGFDYKIS